MFIPLHDTNALQRVKLQYVTLTIIALNILIWFWSGIIVQDDSMVRKAYYAYGFVPAVALGSEILPANYAILPEPLSFVTYSFFHSDFMHLAGNMLFIWVFGDNVEDAMGHWRFLLFYMACAAAGAYAHGLMNLESISPLIGASAAAAGILTAYVMLHPKVHLWVLVLGKIPLRVPAMWAIVAWISFQFYNLIFNAESEVSWAAHVGGIITGAILVVILKHRDVVLFSDSDEGVEPMPPSSSVPNAGKRNSSVSTDDDTPRWGRN